MDFLEVFDGEYQLSGNSAVNPSQNSKLRDATSPSVKVASSACLP